MRLTCLLLLASLCCIRAAAQTPCALDEVLPQPRHQIPLSSDYLFGNVVETEDDVVAVGIPHFDGTGAVGVFRRLPAGWALDAFFSPGAPQSNHVYGNAISLSGGVLAVGAPNSDLHGANSGAVYVYRYDSGTSAWVLEATPYQSGATSTGTAVSVHGATLVAGGQQRVDIFRHAAGSWTHEATLLPPDAGNTSFGDAVALHEDLLVVADDRFSVPEVSKAGRCYTYLRSGTTWSLAATIDPPTPTSSPIHLGEEVDLHGEWAVLSAHLEDAAAPEPGGAVYVYKLASDGTVVTQQTLTAPSPGEFGNAFGRGVAVRGTRLLVGAPGENGTVGAVYVFDLINGVWTQVHHAPQPPGYFNLTAEFGTAVAVDDYLVAGAPRITVLDRTGKVFIVATPCP